MRFLLDTNIVSELMKPSPDSGVVGWMSANQEDAALSALTLAELAAGIEALPEGKRRNSLAKEFSFLQEDYSDRILPFDDAVAWEWALYCRQLRESGLSPSLMDSLIAATARQRHLTIVTRNGSDFPFVETVNPFGAGL